MTFALDPRPAGAFAVPFVEDITGVDIDRADRDTLIYWCKALAAGPAMPGRTRRLVAAARAAVDSAHYVRTAHSCRLDTQELGTVLDDLSMTLDDLEELAAVVGDFP